MILRWAWTIAAIACVVGCNGDKPKKVEPAARGERGEDCEARNDCAPGLACIGGICSRNDFDIAVSAKQCDRIDCETDEDCCGSRPMTAPSKCADRVLVCETPQQADCVTTVCVSDDECGGGLCGPGSCSNTFDECTEDSDCTEECGTDGYCASSFNVCTTAADCTGTCGTRICDCTNPDYDPFADICTDLDCVELCTLKCQDERCEPDTSCESDTDCFGFAADICEGGRCVECREDGDCDEDAGEQCVDGLCDEPCQVNEECGLFHRCEAGVCEESGCTSDRECILAANSGASIAGDDPRLAKCLPSDVDPDVSECKIPCENDGSCGSAFQVCEAGYCRFIGCESDEECRVYLGIENETTDDVKPYVSRAVCR